MSVIVSGSVISPRSVRTVTSSPSAAPISAAVAADSRATGGRAVPARWVRRPVAARVEQHSPARQHRLPVARWCRAARALRGAARPRARPTDPCAPSRRRATARTACPDRRPSSSARMCSTRRSGVALVCSAGSNGRIRPSQLMNEPAFSTTGATGNTTSAQRGDRAFAQLEAHDERCGVDRGQCRIRVGQVGEFDAADQQCAEFTVARRGENAGGVAARARRAGRRHSSAAAVCSRADASATGRPPGSRLGQRAGLQRAPLAGSSRYPRQPRTGGPSQSACRGECSGRGGQPLADQDDRAGRLQLRVVGQAVQRRGLAAGCRRDEPCRASWSARGWRTVRSAITCTPFLRTALRSRRKTIGDSSSGSKSGQQHRGRLLQVGVGDRHRLARDMRGQELRFLGAVRAGAEVDVVGAQHHSGELRVRVGVFARCTRPPTSTPALPAAAASPAPPPRGPPTTKRAAACRRRRGPAAW